MTSLLDRAPTPEDLEAERETPRSGLWAGENGADLRKLTQEETDLLIRHELWVMAKTEEGDAVLAACGGSAEVLLGVTLDRDGPIPVHASRQRGGIDSDPLVRILARRTWGDRDRRWFELRGVRKGEALRVLEVRHVGGRDRDMVGEIVVALAQQREFTGGFALGDADPGALVDAEINLDRLGQMLPVMVGGIPMLAQHGVIRVRCRVSDRLREPPYEAIDRLNRSILPGCVFEDPPSPEATERFVRSIWRELSWSAPTRPSIDSWPRDLLPRR